VCVSRIFLKRTTHKKYWTSRCSQQLIYLLVVTSWRDQRRTSQLPRNSSRDQNVSSRDATNKIILIIDRSKDAPRPYYDWDRGKPTLCLNLAGRDGPSLSPFKNLVFPATNCYRSRWAAYHTIIWDVSRVCKHIF
jgi:hypothetical protein